MNSVFIHLMFGVFGNATALFLFLSPVYGLPFVSPNNLMVSTVNGTGALLESIYVAIFLIYAPPKLRTKMALVLLLVVAVFGSVVLVSLLALQGNPRKLFCGFANATFTIGMYGSPMSIMRVVVKTKSVEYMPFLLSLFVFLCGTSWFIYGFIGRDPFIAVPHGVGSLLGTVQLVLYVIYRNKTRSGEAQPEIDMIVASKAKDAAMAATPTSHDMTSIVVEKQK